MQELIKLFEETTQSKVVSINTLPTSGSNRRYYRILGEKETLIGAYGEVIEENKAFITLSKHFAKQGINVAKLVSVSEDGHYYLQEDLGEICLFDFIKQGRETGTFSVDEKTMLKKTFTQLPKIQFEGAKNLDFSICFPQAEFNNRTIFWDLNYFKYNFLRPSGIEFNEEILENEFVAFAKTLLQEKTNTFLYRDFQSRNIMIKNGEPYFIDFQGGRKGPIYYDVASFLYQAKANLSEEIREDLLSEYLHSLRTYATIDEINFRAQLVNFMLFRNLQVLGAYGFRGLIERKAHFIQSIPFAIENLKQLLQKHTFEELPYLTEILEQLVQKYPKQILLEKKDSLTVRVYSFSYKKGIPEDFSGNGGGYVFDCRAIHNPGKYEKYKRLTGTDKEVKDFLEKDGEILQFLEHVYALANTSVSRYQKRGFTDLMFSFGCTGGQHRSVYAAQHLAEYLAKKHNVTVVLTHREQGKIIFL